MSCSCKAHVNTEKYDVWRLYGPRAWPLISDYVSLSECVVYITAVSITSLAWDFVWTSLLDTVALASCDPSPAHCEVRPGKPGVKSWVFVLSTSVFIEVLFCSLSLCVFLVALCLSVCLCLSLCVCLSHSLSLSSLCPCLCLSLCLAICLPACLSLCLLCLSVCLSLSLSLFPPSSLSLPCLRLCLKCATIP